LFELFPLADTQFRIGIYTAGCGIYSDGTGIVAETMILVEALKRYERREHVSKLSNGAAGCARCVLRLSAIVSRGLCAGLFAGQ